jgi:hypothetical protein
MNSIQLENGLRVGNLSSPHPFKFDDGSVLDAVSAEDSKRLSADPVEEKSSNQGGWTDVKLSFSLSAELTAEISRVNADPDVDIVLVSMPTMTAIKAAGMEIGKCRVVRLVDRATKIVSSSEFCV